MFPAFHAIVAALTGHTLTVSVGLSPAKPVVVEDAGNQSAAASGVSVARITTDQAKAKLRELLSNPKYKFRSIDRLTKAIGAADRFETEELLAEVGARPSRRNPKLFGLTSRVGQRQYA